MKALNRQSSLIIRDERRAERVLRIFESDANVGEVVAPLTGDIVPPDGELGLYANRDFWQTRYERERECEMNTGGSTDSHGGGAGESKDGNHGLFEWYAPWSCLRELVGGIVADRDAPVLELGCGSSSLALARRRKPPTTATPKGA